RGDYFTAFGFETPTANRSIELPNKSGIIALLSDIPTPFSGSFNDLTDTPTTIGGYGITNAVTTTNDGSLLSGFTPNLNEMVGGASLLYVGAMSVGLPTGISGSQGGLLLTGKHAL